MNWFDLILAAVLLAGVLTGVKIGLINATITTVGVIIGWFLASQWSDDLGALFSDSISNDTIITVVSYTIIVSAAAAISRIVSRLVKPLLSIFTMGLSNIVDRAGGLMLGLILGVAISGTIIIALARLTYDFDTPSIPNQSVMIEEQLGRVEAVRNQLERSLTESSLVSIFITVTDAIPADTFGLVPSDFKAALHILDANTQ